jgi:hypothetical protein
MRNLGKTSDIRNIKSPEIARLWVKSRRKLWTLKICFRLSSHLSLACQAFMAICSVPLNNSAVSPFFANTNKNNIFGFIDSTVQYSTSQNLYLSYCDYFLCSASYSVLLNNKV